MHSFKWISAILVAGVCSTPALAQHVTQQQLNNRVENAVQRAQAQQATCSCCGQAVTEDMEGGSLSPQELISAEEELQHIRNVRDPNATFAKYPYLLDPAYRHQASCPCNKQNGTQPAQVSQEEPLSVQEQIEAEEELAQIRNTWDKQATFEKYPYLLNPTYRRASEDGKQSIRRQYTQPTWARKVGI